MKFKKLTMTNDWEYIHTCIGGKEIDPEDFENRKCFIRWQDGNVTEETLCSIRYTTHYSDMGHSCSASGVKLGIIIQHPQLSTKVELPEGIEIEVKMPLGSTFAEDNKILTDYEWWKPGMMVGSL